MVLITFIQQITFVGKKDYNDSFLHKGSVTVSSIEKTIIPNLYPGTLYEFQVSATTACGKGGKSTAITANTKVDGK
jgi:hypothetical protein